VVLFVPLFTLTTLTKCYVLTRNICKTSLDFVNKSLRFARNQMSKSLTRNLITGPIPGMTKQTQARLTMGKAAGFRPTDEAFCDQFNLAMDATGMNLNDLAVAAIKEGLPIAVSKRLATLQKAAEVFSANRPAKNRK